MTINYLSLNIIPVPLRGHRGISRHFGQMQRAAIEKIGTGLADRLTAALEKLNGALMLFRRFARGKCAEIPPLAGFRIFLARIKTITTGF